MSDVMNYFTLRDHSEIPAIANAHIISALEKKYEKILKPGALRKNDEILRKEKQHAKYVISAAPGVVLAVIEYQDGIIQRYLIVSRPSENETIQRSVLNGKVSFKKQKNNKNHSQPQGVVNETIH